MTRRDFTLTLYNNGRGLTLDQISDLDKNLIDTIPDGLIEDLIEETEGDIDKAQAIALDQARDVRIDCLRDFSDPLDLALYFRTALGYEVPDENIIGLFYAVC